MTDIFRKHNDATTLFLSQYEKKKEQERKRREEEETKRREEEERKRKGEEERKRKGEEEKKKKEEQERKKRETEDKIAVFNQTGKAQLDSSLDIDHILPRISSVKKLVFFFFQFK